MGNIESLPKWARDRMTHLERERDHYKKLLEEKMAGQQKSRQWASFFTDRAHESFYLPTGTPVQFELGDGLVEVAIPFRNKDYANELEIRCLHKNGIHEMQFIPQVSNVMRLKLGSD